MNDRPLNLRRRALRNPVLRVVSSIPFGLTVLVLLLVYGSIGSALPPVRGVLELTEMQYFRHWIFLVLVSAFVVSLTLATLLRVRWTVTNAGVLIVHSGLLLLTGGAWWYFAQKVEGDIFLEAPRLELINTGASPPQVVGKVLAAPGEQWSAPLAMFGGAFSLRVDEVQRGTIRPATAVTATVKAADGEPRRLQFTLDLSQHDLDGRFAVRFVAPPPVRTFYDDEAVALYYAAGDPPEAGLNAAPIPRLPAYRERYLPGGTPLRNTRGATVASKRTWPHVDFFGVALPTHWLERWRLPIALETPDLPFRVTVDGYVPYYAHLRAEALGGGTELNPAVRLLFEAGGRRWSRTLFAQDPARGYLTDPVPLEFCWAETPAAVAALSAPLPGPHVLEVRLDDPPLEQTVVVDTGQRIELPGTSYVLTVEQLDPGWPLITPGYEGALTPMASVAVQRDVTPYTRTVLERFPHLSQDIDAAGTRYTDAPYDPNLTLRYRTSAGGRLRVIAGPGLADVTDTLVAVYSANGAVTTRAVALGEFLPLAHSAVSGSLGVLALIERAREHDVPVIQPVAGRRPSASLRWRSAVRLRFEGAGWETQRWVPFSPYLHVDAAPLRFTPPDSDTQFTFYYGRRKYDLGATLGFQRLSVEPFPGETSVSAWRSDFLVQPDGSEQVVAAVVETNDTFTVGPWTFFQSGADNEDRWSWSILGVGNREGLSVMILGSVLVTIGLLYAFYVKPILLRRRRASCAVRQGMRPPAEAAPVPEPAEVTV